MCCLFGLLDYKQSLSLNQRKRILRTLSIACEERGTDATGIAYFIGKQLSIQKAPRPAHRMKFRLPQNAHYIMGHTRMTTQGAEGKNYNNHPFAGKVGGTTFALAHNGVIHNDKELQRTRQLPPTKIETDSYVAVQLLEQEGSLSFKSLKTMAEALCGSFTITVLDQQNNLYIVKGNNPLCSYHFEKGFYLYASTESILQKAVEQLTSKQVEFVSRKEAIDTTTPTGKFMLTVFGAVAELEREYILQRQREGIAVTKANGVYKGRKPIQRLDFEVVVSDWRQGQVRLHQGPNKQNGALRATSSHRRVPLFFFMPNGTFL